MTPTTEAKRKFDLSQEVRSCSDPFGLLTEVLLDNERLRQQLRQYEYVSNKA